MAVDLPLDFTHAQDFINPLVDESLALGISDLHFERRGDEGVLRVRLDGMMREWARLTGEKMDLVVSRIKFISGIDPMQKGVLQQGRFEHETKDGKPVDMRVSVLPTPNMEDTVVRLLASAPTVMKLDDMGLQPHILEGLRKAIKAHQGLIFVTGPTGSGKTTTLYASVQEINDATRKIITVEDPIEYNVEGLTQLKLEQAKGLSYAAILKTILRHDPDVILIGETRDVEAAEIAVEASMTGHLVLTTLHTNSAPATILRLINMGVPAVDVANSVTCVYAQRLVRKLCDACKKPEPVSKELEEILKNQGADIPKQVFAPHGCKKCDGTGYKGRIPIGELMLMDDALRDVILESPTLTALNKAARKMGIKSMLQNGADLAADGLVWFTDIQRTVSE